MTVRGPIDPSQLGRTLVHEHLFMDARPLLAAHGYQSTLAGPFDTMAAGEARWNPGVHPDNYRLDDPDLITRELRYFVDGGGQTIVDVTPPELGRNPGALRQIAEATGVHVVMGIGHYLQPVHPEWLSRADEDSIAARIIDEWVLGVDPEHIRPGIIGEIGTGDPIHDAERRVLRAAASASRRTGLPISVHLQPWGRTGLAVLDELEASGAAPLDPIIDLLLLPHGGTHALPPLAQGAHDPLDEQS